MSITKEQRKDFCKGAAWKHIFHMSTETADLTTYLCESLNVYKYVRRPITRYTPCGSDYGPTVTSYAIGTEKQEFETLAEAVDVLIERSKGGNQ